MSKERASVIRRHFEAYRDLVWFEDLEPRVKGLPAKEVRKLREAWNAHAEAKDWDWWQQKCAHCSNERLEDEIMDITDRLDQLGCLRWQQEQKQRHQVTGHGYEQIVADARDQLIPECFELERDFHYREFRHHHWNLAEIVAICPDPAERDVMLRGFWNQDAEKRFAEYRAAVSGLTVQRAFR